MFLEDMTEPIRLTMIKQENPIKKADIKDIINRIEEQSFYHGHHNGERKEVRGMEVRDYMKLPYTRLVQEMNDESGHYFYGRILELDGCQSTGDTIDKLYESLNEAMKGYLEVKLENGLPIPVPDSASDFQILSATVPVSNTDKLRRTIG